MRSFVTFIVALLLPVASVRSEPVPLSLMISDSGIVISNVTKGGDVVLFSCTRGTRDRRIHVQPLASMLNDDDRDGTVSVSRADGVPIRSVWIAVDYTSGSTATGAHPMFPLLVSTIGVTPRGLVVADGRSSRILGLEPARTVVLFAKLSVPANGVAPKREPAWRPLPSRTGSATRLFDTVLSRPP